jgi:anti-sigma regulatory factor (Ser/Thr protein kinase)
MEDQSNRFPVLRVTLPAQPSCVPRLRHEVGAWVLSLTASAQQEPGSARDALPGSRGHSSDSGPAEAVSAMQQAVSELITNVVQHAYGDGRPVGGVTVTAWVDVHGWAVIGVADTGRWQERTSPRSHHGRGLALARGFVDELIITHGADGTTATIRQRLLQLPDPGDAAVMDAGFPGVETTACGRGPSG